MRVHDGRSLSEFNSIQIASAFYKLARCEARNSVSVLRGTAAKSPQLFIERMKQTCLELRGSPKCVDIDMGMDQYLLIPFFHGMNIHLPAILMFTRGKRFWHTAIWCYVKNSQCALIACPPTVNGKYDQRCKQQPGNSALTMSFIRRPHGILWTHIKI